MATLLLVVVMGGVLFISALRNRGEWCEVVPVYLTEQELAEFCRFLWDCEK